MKISPHLFLVALCLSPGLSPAGTYSQNFTSAALGSVPIGGLGDGTTLASSANNHKIVYWAQNNKALQLMSTLGGNTSSWRFPVLDVGQEVQSFDATFNMGTYRSSASAIPGAGWSLNFGAIPVSGNGSGEGGFVMTNGLFIACDIFNNGGADNPSIEVFCNGTSVGNFPSATLTDSPVVDSGTFTLTNPTNGGTTGPIAYNATIVTVQAAMRLVADWEAVVVTGSTSGPWTVDHGVVGAYASPTSDTTNLVPANSVVTVAVTTTGTALVNAKWSLTPRAYRSRAVAVHWDYDGLDVSYGGATIFTNLQTPGFIPVAGNKFAISTRTESGNTMNLFIDDVNLSSTPLQYLETGGPVITEFMADNSATLEDEDVDSPDWIEIYNGQNASVNLSGYRLTNVFGNNSLWTFPSLTLGPYEYKTIYASGKNRTVTSGLLHTNFTLQKEAGYLALVKPDGVTLASAFNYGQQYQDVSYGEKGASHTLGYLTPPTPGVFAPFSTYQAPQGPSEDVVWSRVGGLIPGSPATSVTITAPVAPSSVIRYTTDNTEPTPGSGIYNPASPPAAFSVTNTANLRARIFTSNHLPGDTGSRTFLKVDATLFSDYNGSALPFSSNLPIVVLDSFGVPVDNYTGSDREYRYTYAVVIAVNPATGRATITDTPDFQGRCGTHVRGESSAGFPQRQYAWELWDNHNADKDASILGMPAESDWILYAPWSDKSLMRDVLTFGTMRKLRTDYMASRTKFCELIYNQNSGSPVDYANGYRGVYAIKEKLKINSERVDIAKLNELTKDAPNVNGGYIFRKDKNDADSTAWGTATYGIGLASYSPDLLTAPQLASLQGYVNSFESALAGASFTNPTTGYAAWMEADTFIDAQWFVEWTKQVDGYVFSTYFHKDRNGKLRAGPIWDFNIALGNADYATGDTPTGWLYDTSGTATGTGSLWYPRLHEDPWYRLRHFDRYWVLRRGILATTAILGDIDANASALLNGSATPVTNSMAPLPPLQENPAMRHFRKFPRLGEYDWPNAPGYASRTTYQSEVSYMKTWLTTRLNWLDDQNYSGTVIYRPPNFSSYGGNVVANFPLTITAYTGAPPSGYTYATGSLYYTTNGTDPRGSNGLPAGTLYTGTLVLTTTQTIQARLYNAGTGSWSPLTSANFIVNSVPASSANLIISELHYRPAAPSVAEIAAGYNSANMFEFIELQNVSGQSVDLSNCKFTLGVTYNFTAALPTDLSLASGQRIILAGNKNAFLFRYGNNAAVKIVGEFAGNLNNSGERVTFLAANNSVIADFTYGVIEPWPVASNGGGYSLVLNNPTGNPNYAAGLAWRSSPQIGGSPGLTNTVAFTGSPGGDTDKDGLTDFMEYALGSSWTTASSRAETSCAFIQDPPFAPLGTYLQFSFPRNLWADGVIYTPEQCTALSGWSGSGLVYLETVNNGNGTATVRYRSSLSISAATLRSFLRLTASPP